MKTSCEKWKKYVLTNKIEFSAIQSHHRQITSKVVQERKGWWGIFGACGSRIMPIFWGLEETFPHRNFPLFLPFFFFFLFSLWKSYNYLWIFPQSWRIIALFQKAVFVFLWQYIWERLLTLLTEYWLNLNLNTPSRMMETNSNALCLMQHLPYPAQELEMTSNPQSLFLFHF